MFDSIRQRLRDAATINALCAGAERHAHAAGQTEPAAEHFVLAALDLPDGSARRVFEHLRLDPAQFSAAIEQQYRDALRASGIGWADPLPEPPRLPAAAGVYRARASAQGLMDELARQVMPQARQAAGDPAAPLLGAHVIVAASAARHGVVARAMQVMGSDHRRLAAAAAAVLASS